jgi:hypothetical protein
MNRTLAKLERRVLELQEEAREIMATSHSRLERLAARRFEAALNPVILALDDTVHCGVCGSGEPIECPFGCGMSACRSCLADAHAQPGDTIDDPERPCPQRPTPARTRTEQDEPEPDIGF